MTRRVKGFGFTALIIVLAILLLDRIDVPHPLIYSPERSAQKIRAASENHRWMVAHGYGGLCAEHLKISEFRVRGDALPDGLEHAFYDGAAHHQQVDFEDIEAQVADIKKHIPRFYWLLFFDGIIRAYTAVNAHQPEAVLAWASRLQKVSGAESLVNGIRIGIQQGYGDNMPEAIRIAAQFPEDMHSMLFEELGWRIGDEGDINASLWTEFAASIPNQADCSFAEGMTRGRILWLMGEDESWWSHVSSFREDITKRCQSHIDSGIAEALLIAVGDRPEARSAEAHQIPDEHTRDGIVRIMEERLARVP